jgi:hypothetical protein
MGSSTIIDIISSAVVAGILFLMTGQLNIQTVETATVYHGNLQLQRNMTTLVGIVEHDFRRIAYCADYKKIPAPNVAIRAADSSSIRFWTDVDNDGNVDSISYYLGPVTELEPTPNPRDRKLYRVVNNDIPVGWDLGVTGFRFKYFNSEGDTLPLPVPDPREVYSMEISIAIESSVPINQSFTVTADTLADFQVFWRQLRLAARNLRNR